MASEAQIPCVFCGAVALTMETISQEQFYLHCHACGGSGPIGEGKLQARQRYEEASPKIESGGHLSDQLMERLGPSMWNAIRGFYEKGEARWLQMKGIDGDESDYMEVTVHDHDCLDLALLFLDEIQGKYQDEDDQILAEFDEARKESTE